jgi:hypothetical protein
MALREKLAERAAPYLEPGERIQSVFLAQSGPSPYWSLLTYWITIFKAGFATIVVTDRAIVVLKNGRLTGSKAKSLLARGPRNVWLGTPTGLWGQIQLDQRYWVHKRFHKDVVAADDALRAMYPQGGQAPGQPPAGYPQGQA